MFIIARRRLLNFRSALWASCSVLGILVCSSAAAASVPTSQSGEHEQQIPSSDPQAKPQQQPQQPSSLRLAENEAADPASKSKHSADQEPIATSSGSAVQELVVQAQRSSVTLAREAQKEAPNVINIETYKEIRKLPDISVAEAVRRVPGVSMEMDEGEGRYINIRGFDADLNNTTFDGLRLLPTNNASPFGGYRAVALDSIPIGVVGAITVTKSTIPSQDAEGLGGTIDISPKTAPPGSAPFIEGDIGTGYEPLRGTPIYNFQMTAGARFGGDHFGEGPFSVVLTGSVYNDRRGIDDVEPGYINNAPQGDPQYHAITNIQRRDYELHRRRHSFGVELGYQPNDNNEYYVRAFEAGYTEWYWDQYLNLTPDGNVVTLPNGHLQDTLSNPTAIQKALRDEQETSIERVVVVGGRNTFGNATLDYRAGYVSGTYNKPYDYNSAFDYTGPVSPGGPTLTYSPNGIGHTILNTIAGADYLNPANYTLDPGGFNNSTAYNFDRAFNFAANLELKTHWLGADTESLKFGVSAELRHKGEQLQPYFYSTLPALSLANASSGGSETYYSGQYQNGVDITPGYLQSLLGPGQSSGDPRGALQQYLDARENIIAGYAQYQFAFGDLNVLAGVRVENTMDHTSTYALGTDSSGAPLPPILVHGDRNYTNVFPSVQLKYTIQPDLIARATYSTNIARPGFNQFSPSTSFDLGSLTVTTGNPNLRPATSNSFDVSLSKYLAEGGIVSLGFFDKQISNYIVPNALTNQVPPSFLGFHDPVLEVTFTNSGPSYARGLEASWEQRFSQLPGLLSGLGAGGNVTYVDSRYQIRPGQYSKLPSTSTWTWNADIFYEEGPVTVRFAAYSVSADLFGIGSDPSSDIYNATRTYADLGASYAVTRNLTLYFNAKNLLNTPTTYYMGTSDRPIQREFYGLTYQGGLRFNF